MIGFIANIFFCSYPKDSDKVMLAKQTGLTRSQVHIQWIIDQYFEFMSCFFCVVLNFFTCFNYQVKENQGN
jgi:hypothetical protein